MGQLVPFPIRPNQAAAFVTETLEVSDADTTDPPLTPVTVLPHNIVPPPATETRSDASNDLTTLSPEELIGQVALPRVRRFFEANRALTAKRGSQADFEEADMLWREVSQMLTPADLQRVMAVAREYFAG